MALKKGVLDNYIKEREVSIIKKTPVDSKYSHNRVFDEPESLKKLTSKQSKLPASRPNEKATYTPNTETDSIGFNRLQTASETVSKMPSLSEIKILFYINEMIIEKGQNTLRRNQIAEALSLTLSGVKTGLVRLKKKGFIHLVTSAKGRYTGYTSYSLTSEAYQVLSSLEARNLLGFKRFQTVAETVSMTRNSSSIINKTTTFLPEAWQKINITPLADINFTHKHLADIFETHLTTAEIVQESINHFAYGLEFNPDKYKNYKDPLNVLIGCLRKGKVWYESTYISPQERALKELIERKKTEKERLHCLENELINNEFHDWKATLTLEQKRSYLPTKIIGPEDAHLKSYFTANVWPGMRSTLLSKDQL